MRRIASTVRLALFLSKVVRNTPRFRASDGSAIVASRASGDDGRGVERVGVAPDAIEVARRGEQPAHGEVGEERTRPRGAPRRRRGTGTPSRPATRNQFCVPSSFDIKVSAVRRGSTARSSPRSTPSLTIAASSLDELLALGPVPGERAAVAGRESVDLVEVVGQGAQRRHIGPDHPVELHRRAIRRPRAPGPRARAAHGSPRPRSRRAARPCCGSSSRATAAAGRIGGRSRPSSCRRRPRSVNSCVAAATISRRGSPPVAGRGAPARAAGTARGGFTGGDHARKVARVRNGRVNSGPAPLTRGTCVPQIGRQLSQPLRNPGRSVDGAPPDTSTTLAARDHARAQGRRRVAHPADGARGRRDRRRGPRRRTDRRRRGCCGTT